MVMNIVIQRLIMSAALSLWTGLCSLHGEAEQLVPRGRDLWASTVLPTQMTRLHHSGLLSNNSYLITGQIYQSDVIIYTSILELSLEFRLQELLLFFILKNHATVSANGSLTCNIDMLKTHGAKLYLLME